MIKHREGRYDKYVVPFLDEMSGLGRIELFEIDTYHTLTLKITLERTNVFLKVLVDSMQVTVLDPKRAIAILHVSYYKI